MFAFAISTEAQIGDTLIFSKSEKRKSKEERVITDSTHTTNRLIEERFNNLLFEGYLEATIDTLRAGNTLFCSVRAGKYYRIERMVLLVDSNTTMDSRVVNKPLNSGILRQEGLRLIKDYENNGYPFVRVTIDSLTTRSVKPGVSRASIYGHLTPGPWVVMDSLHIRSAQPLPYHYIQSYLDFNPGAPYNEEKITRTEKRLKELPFLTLRQSPEIRFTPGKASLFVFAEKRKANYFNGIAGIRPDESTGKTHITGDAEIKLINAFNHGEELWLNWRKLQVQTQDLALKMMLPYLFQLPLGVDGQLKIYKRDTTFSSIKLGTGLNFMLSGNNRIRLFIEKNKSDQLSTYATASTLAGINSTLYGGSIQYEQLDYRWNPRKGLSCGAELAMGSRALSAKPAEASIERKLPITRAEGHLEYYIPLFKRHCLLTAVKGAALFAETLYDNEMFRIGGLRTMRGINEESIYAVAWSVATVEYRILLEENSAVYVFGDQCWYEKRGVSGFDTDHPLSFGAGFNFETKAGIFTFNYALGKQYDNPILVRNGKVSFGFRNVF
jgi:outer membrane protein assembly factor BamA